jgi:hypothetical protein
LITYYRVQHTSVKVCISFGLPNLSTDRIKEGFSKPSFFFIFEKLRMYGAQSNDGMVGYIEEENKLS